MKKVLFYSIALVVMIATAACSKNELGSDPEIKGQTIKVKIRGGVAETRTGVDYEDGAYYPYWNEGDKISVFFDDFESKNKPDATLTNVNSKGETADFSGEITLANGTTIGEEGRILSFYPASAFQTDGVISSEESVRLNLKTSQEPAADSYDPAADILVGQPSDYIYIDGELLADIAFARVMSVVKVTLKAAGDCPANIAVNRFTMTAPDGMVLTGRSKVSLAALYGSDSPVGEWTVKNNEVSALYSGDFHPVIGGSENTVYLIVNPTTIASGSQVTFTMESDNYNISKTVTLGKALAFPQGNVANINLTIANENCTPVVVETRIYVEDFGKVTTSAVQYQPSQTGAKGTGLNSETSYDYGTDTNTNIRFNSNGHTATDPYLYLRANATFTINNIAISNQENLVLNAQTKNTSTVNVYTKVRSSQDWTKIDTWTSTGSFSEQMTTFAISNEATSIDIKFEASSATIIDDIVLNVDSRTKLSNPTNVVASLDSETPNKINVSWTAVEHADKYEVVLSDNEEKDVVFESNENSVEATGLAYEKEYSIKVKAVTTDLENYIDSEYANASSTVTTGAKPSVVSGWIKTDISDIDPSDVVVIVGRGYGIRNDEGTDSSPDCVSVTISDDQITSEVPDNIKWNIGGNADDGYIFYVNGDSSNWLYCNTTAASSSNDNIRVGTGSRKTWKINNNGYFENTKGGDTTYVKRILSQNNTSDWRSYINENTNPQKLDFYVYIDGRSPQTLTYSKATGSIDMNGDVRDIPSLDTTGAVTTITYTSSVETVATVDENTGIITAVAVGETVITATAVADSTHQSANATFTLTVSDSTPVLTLLVNEKTVDAVADSYSIVNAYTLSNCDDGDVAVSIDNTVVASASIENGTVLFTTNENTSSDARDGGITLTLGEAQFVITIHQSGAGAVPVLESISVKTAPTKVAYTVGEKFNPAGLILSTIMSDSSAGDDVSYAGHESEFTFSPSLSTALTLDHKSVTITYNGKSTTQAITVNPGSIEINVTNSGVTGSYADKTFTVSGITFGFTQWMKNNNIQAKKSTANSCYNTTAIPGKIKKITVVQTGTARAITMKGGISEKPTNAITSPTTAATMVFDFSGKNYTYFTMATPGNAVYINTITIEYEN